MESVDAILCADIHIRADIPECRTDKDEYQKEQWSKWSQIIDLSEEFCAPIIVAGDLGHKPQWPSGILRKFIQISFGADRAIIVVPGQHDLPYHKVDSWRESALGVLEADGAIEVCLGTSRNPFIIDSEINIYDFPWGVSMDRRLSQSSGYNVAVTHQLVMEGKGNKMDWPGADASFAIELLKAYPQYCLILSGDNHLPFVVEHEGRLLVNPGSMMRMTASQINHKPRVYLWNRHGQLKTVYLNISENVITRDHIEKQKAKENRMEAFIKSVNEGVEVSLSFETNVEEVIKEQKTPERVAEKVWECINE